MGSTSMSGISAGTAGARGGIGARCNGGSSESSSVGNGAAAGRGGEPTGSVVSGGAAAAAGGSSIGPAGADMGASGSIPISSDGPSAKPEASSRAGPPGRARGRPVASRCFSSICRASRSSTSRRPGSTFWIFFRTETALAAKPSRANWSASGIRSEIASCFLSARIRTSASCMRRLGLAPFFWSCAFSTSIARAYFFAAIRETTSSSLPLPNPSATDPPSRTED